VFTFRFVFFLFSFFLFGNWFDFLVGCLDISIVVDLP
jgi:hypothetical protein